MHLLFFTTEPMTNAHAINAHMRIKKSDTFCTERPAILVRNSCSLYCVNTDVNTRSYLCCVHRKIYLVSWLQAILIHVGEFINVCILNQCKTILFWDKYVRSLYHLKADFHRMLFWQIVLNSKWWYTIMLPGHVKSQVLMKAGLIFDTAYKNVLTWTDARVPHLTGTSNDVVIIVAVTIPIGQEKPTLLRSTYHFGPIQSVGTTIYNTWKRNALVCW